MPEIRISFDKDWTVERRMQAIQQREDNLKDCNVLKRRLEKYHSTGHNVGKTETSTWMGLPDQELMLKTATGFLITYEFINTINNDGETKMDNSQEEG